MASQTATVEADAAGATSGVSRREFLYYIWGASIALLTLQSAGLLVWFLYPRFREGEFGGAFTIGIDDIPQPNTEPINYPDGRFWLVNLNTNDPNALMYQAPDEPEPIVGVAAIYKVCTHLGCIYSWTPANERFECPCHGSKYRLDGRRIEAPAPRNLDRFFLEAVGQDGNVLAFSEVQADQYSPVALPAGTVAIRIDTGDRQDGSSEELLCDFQGNCP